MGREERVRQRASRSGGGGGKNEAKQTKNKNKNASPSTTTSLQERPFRSPHHSTRRVHSLVSWACVRRAVGMLCGLCVACGACRWCVEDLEQSRGWHHTHYE